MRTIKTILLLAHILTVSSINAQHSSSLGVTNYDLRLSFDFKQQTLQGSCAIQLSNHSDSIINKIPLLLYRLMNVQSVSNIDGAELNFSQKITQFEDFPKLQVNYIEINESLFPGETKAINIYYKGFLLGYSETGLNYVTDRISPEFTIIRIDAYAYPVVSKPSITFLLTNIMKQSYEYTIEVTVPDKLVVANGGYLISKLKHSENLTTYKYKSKKPGFRIDIAIAPYKILHANGLDVFFINDEEAAKMIAEMGEKIIDLYTKWWGPLNNQKTIAIIETEKGSGGQADETAILMPAEGFSDITNFRFLFHELSHFWNVRIGEEQGLAPRWEEGLAAFCEYLIDERFNTDKKDLLKRAGNGMIKRFKENLESNDELMHTPMIEYGNKQLTKHSYEQPMIMFAVLYFWIGEELFNNAIGGFYRQYCIAGASTDDFVEFFTKTTKNYNLSLFFNEWVYTTDYTNYIMKNMNINDIVDYYKSL